MIEARNVFKKFGDKVILDGVSGAFSPGRVNLVIGASGSGKTVFMKCLVGLMEADSGAVIYDEQDFSAMNHRQRKPIQQQIGMLFQGGALFDSMNVEKNVMFPLVMFSDMTPAERADRVSFCLERVHLENAGHLYPSEISGGMKKRVAIARAIANNPKYLFCDEPNSGLDPRTALVIDELIEEITEEFRMTTIVNTHDMNTVMGQGNRIMFIHQGRKSWEGSVDELMRSDNKELNDFVFASRVMQGLKKV